MLPREDQLKRSHCLDNGRVVETSVHKRRARDNRRLGGVALFVTRARTGGVLKIVMICALDKTLLLSWVM